MIDSNRWVNIPQPLIDSINFLLESQKQTQASLTSLKETVDHRHSQTEKRQHAIVQKFDETITEIDQKVKSDVRDCVKKVDYCKDLVKDTEFNLNVAIKKQYQKTNNVSKILSKSFTSMNAEIEKGMAEKEMNIMRHFDKRIGMVECRLHEFDQ